MKKIHLFSVMALCLLLLSVLYAVATSNKTILNQFPQMFPEISWVQPSDKEYTGYIYGEVVVQETDSPNDGLFDDKLFIDKLKSMGWSETLTERAGGPYTSFTSLKKGNSLLVILIENITSSYSTSLKCPCENSVTVRLMKK